MDKNIKICVVGLGYVGLPLAIELGKKFDTVGLDISKKRISELKKKIDRTKEVKISEFLKSKKLIFTSKQSEIQNSNFIIVTVPTPINKNKKPDLKPIKSACNMIGKNIKKGSIVVFESTVYPGLSEELCVPIIEKNSGFKWKRDFFIGYSPERINPGDSKRSLVNIIKVISGDTKKTLNKINFIYTNIIKAGTYKAESIKIAEAAKVIENTQRDLNIAFMNELSMIFNKMNIDTKSVINAASTKWNFHNYSPGLVGGHCIGVDPYYLTYKAKEIGIDPLITLGGRHINDNMHKYVTSNIKRLSKKVKLDYKNCNIVILGATFKENCPDLRNSRVHDLFQAIFKENKHVKIHDFEANIDELDDIYNKQNIASDSCILSGKDILVLATPHKKYLKKEFLKQIKESKIKIIIDVKSVLDKRKFKDNAIIWSL
jgi:UDP-N-acetyl-D-galactosamine dehydrogenase